MSTLTPQTMWWVVHPDYPRYEVSEFGDVRWLEDLTTRKKGALLKLYVNTDGYLSAALTNREGVKKHVLIHRLVIEAFCGPAPSPLHEVAHNNGSRIHNHYSNLRWDTRKGNADDREVHGTASKGMANGRAKLTDDDVRYIRSEYPKIKVPGSGRSVSELDEMFGIHRATTLGIAKGRTWKHVE